MEEVLDILKSKEWKEYSDRMIELLSQDLILVDKDDIEQLQKNLNEEEQLWVKLDLLMKQDIV